MINTEVLIIGGGAAGLTAAIELSKNYKVSIISKETIIDSSTWYAQGGIAAVMGEKDTVEEHISDTLEVGDGICDEDAVAHCVQNSKAAINWLIEMGVNFTMTKDGEKLHLTQEGGHSKRRVAHSKDTTGKEVSNSLIAHARKIKNIKIYENHLAVDLITKNQSCLGAYIFDKKREEVITFKSNVTILASGGASKVYLYTSNPDGTSGDGMALAWRAGCELSNMEFNQFHPTCLYHPEAKSFLISEALRGEGAFLINHENERFMKKYHEKNELAPRDVVARSIDEEMKKTGKDFMFLDISHKPSKMILKSFPAIHEKCLSYGFDITKDKIPIVPAAHYSCGGVKTGLSGETNINKLYAIGETACTGLHGANRMASNSLLECIVFAKSAALHIEKNFSLNEKKLKNWDSSKVIRSGENVLISHNWDETRRLMWDYVGVVRSNDRLLKAKQKIKIIQNEVESFYKDFELNSDFIELRNLVLIARLIIESAILRKESRGLHYNIDFPNKLSRGSSSIISKKKIKVA